MHIHFKTFHTVLFIVIILNLIFLDGWVYKNRIPKAITNIIGTTLPNTQPPQKAASHSAEPCTTTCPTQPPTPSPTNTPTPTVTQKTTTIVNSAAKEFYVDFGTGTNQRTDWTDVPGIQAYIDNTSYGKIMQITFEASVFLPSSYQTVSVRLYDKTDQHPVWFSEVTMQSGTSALLISNPITLDDGKKLYQVQMKNQLAAPANLVQSRVHITTE